MNPLVTHRSDRSPGALQRFQDGFVRAMLEPDGGESHAPDIAALASQPAFAVYRNTVMKGCIDALQANYPTVARLVGDEWFRAAASIFARANLPSHPMLLDYGKGFERFLAGFEPAQDLPYLPGVARLDRFWTEAHMARDEASVDSRELAALDDEHLLRLRLRPIASARWCWFDAQPAFTIWQRNRSPGAVDEAEIDWHGEGALVVRTNGAVQWLGLDAASHAFVVACAEGGTLADAASAALAIDPDVDPAALVGPLLVAGAFACPADVAKPRR